MKFNQIWFGVSTSIATLTALLCFIRGYFVTGSAFTIIAIAEYVIAAYIFEVLPKLEKHGIKHF
jgi:hypothetical protein